MPYNELSASAATVTVSIPTLGAPRISYGKTVLEYIRDINEALGGRFELTEPRLREWLNTAYRELPILVDIPAMHVGFSFTVPSGTRVAAIDDRVLKIDNASTMENPASQTVGSYDTELDFVSVDSYRKTILTTGRPNAFTFDAGLMGFDPVADKALTVVVDAYIIPLPMTDDTHSICFGKEWERPVSRLATFYALEEVQEWDEAAQVYNSFLATLRSRQDFRSEQKAAGVAAFRPARGRLSMKNIRRGF